MTVKCIAYQDNGNICSIRAVAFILIFLIYCISVAEAQESFVLDCRVSKLNPALYMAFDNSSPTDNTFLKILESQKFRFIILPGKTTIGWVSINGGNNIPAKIRESETHYQIDFGNKTVVVDRMTGNFQLKMQGAQGYISEGICQRLGHRKF